MTQNFLDGLQALLTQTWRFFKSIPFPGTNMSFGAILLSLIILPIFLSVLKSLLGLGSASDLSSASRQYQFREKE